MDLDTKFGKFVVPQTRQSGTAIDVWELTNVPASMTVLNKDTAKQLRRFMEDTNNGFKAGQVLMDDVIVIWVIDEAGSVRFAIEEMVQDSIGTGLPKLQSFPPTRFLPKLGHPSLVNEDGICRGRIGGEIRMATGVVGPMWTVNRRSGRYGYASDRIFIHLKNAADQFRLFGIELKLEADF